MNSGGAAIVTTIKSGGNEFKGLEHLSYEPGSFVGSNAESGRHRPARATVCPNNASGQPQCANPEPAVLGGPRRSRRPDHARQAWFYGAYNHFKIDKLVVGHQPEEFSDLGIFDNYTGKGTWKPGSNDTFIGYFQQGRKQKPRRGISALLPPESVRAQDSNSRMYKGEWQQVLSDRTFFNVNVGNFTLDWPMAVQGRSGDATRRKVFRHHDAVAGAGWNAFSTYRKKPQLKAQLTYYLPEQGRQPRLQVRVREHPRTRIATATTGRSGQIRYSYAVRRHEPARRIGSGSSTPVRPATMAPTGRVGANTDSALRRLRPGSLVAEQQPDVHARRPLDYQRVGYDDAMRKPLITDVLADGTRIFPTSTNVTARRSGQEHQHRAPARRHLGPEGQGHGPC